MTASENLAVVRAYADAWLAGDLARLIGLYAEDFTLHYAGANRLSGIHAGRDAALGALAAFGAATKRRLISIVDVMAGEERAAIIARERFELDPPVELERLLVYRVGGGLLRECWLYDADQALIDRLIGP